MSKILKNWFYKKLETKRIGIRKKKKTWSSPSFKRSWINLIWASHGIISEIKRIWQRYREKWKDLKDLALEKLMKSRVLTWKNIQTLNSLNFWSLIGKTRGSRAKLGEFWWRKSRNWEKVKVTIWEWCKKRWSRWKPSSLTWTGFMSWSWGAEKPLISIMLVLKQNCILKINFSIMTLIKSMIFCNGPFNNC